MDRTRRALIVAAAATQQLVGSPEVAAAWEGPSSLTGFTVGGLAAHVTTVLASCHRCIDDPDTEDEPLPAEAYYTTFTLTEPGSDANATVVAHGQERARHGAAATSERFGELLSSLEEKLKTVPEGRTVRIFGLVPMRLDDFFLTRALEFVVHSDDLAASVGVPTPEFDPESLEQVAHHLLNIARFRHGDVAVVRAFTRRERDDLDALRVL